MKKMILGIFLLLTGCVGHENDKIDFSIDDKLIIPPCLN